MDRPPLMIFSRTAAVLRARQFVVFFAMALYLVDVILPLVTGWLAAHQPLADLVSATDTPFEHFTRRPGAAIALVIVAYLVIAAWLRCGYIRSIVGGRHHGPADRRQFGAMLLLETALLCVGAGLATVADRAGAGSDLLFVLLPALVLTTLLALYADYAIVIAGVGVIAALRHSWLTVRANLMVSLLVVLLLGMLTGPVSQGILDSAAGDWVAVVPTLILATVVTGCVAFVGDVALITIYVSSIERRVVRRSRAD